MFTQQQDYQIKVSLLAYKQAQDCLKRSARLNSILQMNKHFYKRFIQQKSLFSLYQNNEGFVSCPDSFVQQGLLAMQFSYFWRYKYLQDIKKINGFTQMSNYLNNAAQKSQDDYK